MSSTTHTCDWVLLGAMLTGEEEAGLCVFLVGRPDFVVDRDGWYVNGLSGAGSSAFATHVPGTGLPKWTSRQTPLDRV
jgi:hypothetical protein